MAALVEYLFHIWEAEILIAVGFFGLFFFYFRRQKWKKKTYPAHSVVTALGGHYSLSFSIFTY